MTAYGRAEVCSPQGLISVEVQSLNRKYLEIAISLPKELSALEMEMRKWVESRIGRGKVTLKVNARFDSSSPLAVIPNLSLARQVKEALSTIASDLHISSEIELEDLLQISDILHYQIKPQEEHLWGGVLKEACSMALDQAEAMRLTEGKAIEKDFIGRLKVMADALAEIERIAPSVKDKYREKLKTTLLEFTPQNTELEERLLREVAIYAEKVDISEEIMRFKSHLQQFSQKLTSNGSNVGKTLEFILQELGREINTIGAKAQDIAISQAVVSTKCELERIREQVQNVE